MDFSTLNDDQLLLLLKTAMAEAMTRGGAVRVAAQDEVLSAQEKLEIENRVIAAYQRQQAEAERQRVAQQAEEALREKERQTQAAKTESTWSHKAAIVAAIREWGYAESFELNIWSRGADRRVYLQQNSAGRRLTTVWKFVYYVTGNQYNPPRTLEGEGADCWFDDKKDKLKKFLQCVADGWKGDLKLTDDVGTVEPSARLQQYRQVLELASMEEINTAS